MRRAARTDANQRDIVDALRSVGATVQPLHAVGAGCPDILVGWRGTNYLIEIKDGDKPPSQRKLTSAENAFHALWGGHVAIVNNVNEALEEIGAI